MTGDAVAQHYTRGDLQELVLQALIDDGFEPDDLDPEALAPAEEFHTLGRVATIALADAAGIGPDDHVLDVGSGLAGPARLLARRYGARVTGIDLTPELVEVATDLTRRVGLAERVELHQGDALDLPFDDATFDVVWTQHVSMNIADKAGLFGEMRRVVKPGGRLAFFDILAGPEQPIHFPVPWADDASTSALATPDETRSIIEALGFEVRVWDDVTQKGIEFFQQLAANPPQPRGLGLHLLVPDMPTKGMNLAINAVEGRIVIQRGVADAR